MSKSTIHGGKSTNQPNKKGAPSQTQQKKEIKIPIPRQLDEKVVITALKIDSRISERSDRYISDNLNSYRLVISLWGLIVADNTGDPLYAQHLYDAIQRYGLLWVIEDADKFATQTLSTAEGRDVVEHEELSLWYSIKGRIALNQSYFLKGAEADVQLAETMRILLATVRFPKRFSPLHATTLHKKGLDKFRSIEQRNSAYNVQDRFYNAYLTPRIKQIISELLEDYTLDTRAGYYSTGSQMIGKNSSSPNKAKKVLYNPKVTHPTWHFSDIREDSDFVCIKAVNKSYKTARIIGQECADIAYCAQAVNTSLRDAVGRSKYAKCFHFDDQRPNALACARASVDGRLATIDQTSASDSICWDLVATWFPNHVLTDLLSVRPKYAVIDGSRKLLQMAFSSGHACTATVQTIVFFAIDLAVVELVSCFTGADYSVLEDVVVYNDDQVVPCFAVEAIKDAHERYGLITNLEKSYWVGPYREACGEEMWQGISVSSYYFPRKTLEWETLKLPATYAALVDFQKHIVSSAAAESYLESVLIKICRYCKVEPTFSLTGEKDIRSNIGTPLRVKQKRPGVVESITLKIEGDMADAFHQFSTDPGELYSRVYNNPLGRIHESVEEKMVRHHIPVERLRCFIVTCRYNCDKESWKGHIIDENQAMKAYTDYVRWLCGTTVTISDVKEMRYAPSKRTGLYKISYFSWTDGKGMKVTSVDPSFDGEKHTVAKEARKSGKLSSELLSTIDMFRYHTFLNKGPCYPDKLSELLGISDTPVPVSELNSTSTIVWGSEIDR